jgi:hypothetical protein
MRRNVKIANGAFCLYETGIQSDVERDWLFGGFGFLGRCQQ